MQFERCEILTEVISRSLKVGDYGAEFSDGTVCPVFFERKSLGDLFSTMTSGHDRFKRELLRARALNVRLVLGVEGSISQVLQGSEYSSISGKTIIRKLMTLWLKYDLVPMFFKTREEMAFGIKEFYLSFGRNYKLKGDNNDFLDRSNRETKEN